MTFTLRSQAFCVFIHVTFICHEISQFSVCPHKVVLCEGICTASMPCLNKTELEHGKTKINDTCIM